MKITLHIEDSIIDSVSKVNENGAAVNLKGGNIILIIGGAIGIYDRATLDANLGDFNKIPTSFVDIVSAEDYEPLSDMVN